MRVVNYKEEHRKLWSWLADHPEMDKEDYFKGWPEEHIPLFECFACEAADERLVLGTDFCELCPLDAGVIGCFRAGLYIRWAHARSLKEKSEYAREIAELPWEEVQHE